MTLSSSGAIRPLRFVTSAYNHERSSVDAFERKYACPEPGCTRSFDRPSDLDRHSVVHSGIRAFKCPQCGNSYKQATSLKLHMNKAHLKKRVYICGDCSKQFLDPSAANRHRKEKHSPPFVCPMGCRKRTKRKSEFVNHLQSAHGWDGKVIERTDLENYRELRIPMHLAQPGCIPQAPNSGLLPDTSLYAMETQRQPESLYFGPGNLVDPSVPSNRYPAVIELSQHTLPPVDTATRSPSPESTVSSGYSLPNPYFLTGMDLSSLPPSFPSVGWTDLEPLTVPETEPFGHERGLEYSSESFSTSSSSLLKMFQVDPAVGPISQYGRICREQLDEQPGPRG